MSRFFLSLLILATLAGCVNSAPPEVPDLEEPEVEVLHWNASLPETVTGFRVAFATAPDAVCHTNSTFQGRFVEDGPVRLSWVSTGSGNALSHSWRREATAYVHAGGQTLVDTDVTSQSTGQYGGNSRIEAGGGGQREYDVFSVGPELIDPERYGPVPTAVAVACQQPVTVTGAFVATTTAFLDVTDFRATAAFASTATGSPFVVQGGAVELGYDNTTTLYVNVPNALVPRDFGGTGELRINSAQEQVTVPLGAAVDHRVTLEDVQSLEIDWAGAAEVLIVVATDWIPVDPITLQPL